MATFWRGFRADGRDVMRARRQTPEKATQQHIKQYLRLKGCWYYDLSQPRAAMQTPGLPDLLVFMPKLVFIEVKSATGRLTPAQRDFQARCAAAQVSYLVARSVGDVVAALE